MNLPEIQRKCRNIFVTRVTNTDLKWMKFLLYGYFPRDTLDSICIPGDLFDLLEQHHLVINGNIFIVLELLLYIRRNDILELLGFNEEQILNARIQCFSYIDPFLNLLLQIGIELEHEDIFEDKRNYMELKLRYWVDFPGNKNTDITDIFSEMIFRGFVMPKKLYPLERIFNQMNREDIGKRINEFSEIIKRRNYRLYSELTLEERYQCMKKLEPESNYPPSYNEIIHEIVNNDNKDSGLPTYMDVVARSNPVTEFPVESKNPMIKKFCVDSPKLPGVIWGVTPSSAMLEHYAYENLPAPPNESYAMKLCCCRIL